MNKEIAAILENESRLQSMTRAVFEEVDRDRSGFIDKSELYTAMKKFAKTMRMDPPSEEDATKIYQELDANSDGHISLDEFLILIRETLRRIIGWKPPDIPEGETESEEAALRRQEAQRQAAQFRDYVEASGLRKAFQVIFAEVVTKKIEAEHVFAYSAMRLRQLGQEISEFLPEELRAPKAQ